MSQFQVSVGEKVSFSKTVAESDVYQFAGITGDLAPVHVNEAYMKNSAYGRRIAHGVLIVGFMSTTSSIIVKDKPATEDGEVAVSLGYDRVRFIKPVFIGDTVTVDYEVKSIDVERRRSIAEINVTNQHGECVCVAQHVLKWVRNQAS